jgi:DNA-binding MarR family transcriptional regulator
MVYPDQLPRYLRHISNVYLRIRDKKLKEFGHHYHHDVLLILLRTNHSITQKELSELTYIDKSQMVAIINFLFEYEFINIKQNPDDRRENFITLSQKGKNATIRIKESEEKLYNDMIQSLDTNDVKSLYNILTILELNLKQMT